MKKEQLAGLIFLNSLESMKATLELLEFKKLEEQGLIEKCPKHKTLRRGYQNCECSGSSYINKIDKKK